jgi:hypothetical protein
VRAYRVPLARGGVQRRVSVAFSLACVCSRRQQHRHRRRAAPVLSGFAATGFNSQATQPAEILLRRVFPLERPTSGPRAITLVWDLINKVNFCFQFKRKCSVNLYPTLRAPDPPVSLLAGRGKPVADQGYLAPQDRGAGS